ncbi:MAG: MFS transporter, partial [Candidatus Hodarchaeota archaeon]
QTITQETVPDELRGKIFSFINLSITVSQILGMGIVSIVASTPLGISSSLVMNGIVLILFFILGYFWLNKKQLELVADVKREEYYQKVNQKSK